MRPLRKDAAPLLDGRQHPVSQLVRLLRSETTADEGIAVEQQRGGDLVHRFRGQEPSWIQPNDRQRDMAARGEPRHIRCPTAQLDGGEYRDVKAPALEVTTRLLERVERHGRMGAPR